MQNNKDGISFKKAEGQTIILLDETFVWIFAMSLPDKKVFLLSGFYCKEFRCLYKSPSIVIGDKLLPSWSAYYLLIHLTIIIIYNIDVFLYLPCRYLCQVRVCVPVHLFSESGKIQLGLHTYHLENFTLVRWFSLKCKWFRGYINLLLLKCTIIILFEKKIK